MIGLFDIDGSPAEVCLASGHSAAHMSAMSAVPVTAAIRRPTPSITATPIASRPSMNSQSAQASPAQLWNVLSNGPTATLERNPRVGEPPLTQALSDAVAYPNPKVLSRNAHRNTNPVATRSVASQPEGWATGSGLRSTISSGTCRTSRVGLVVDGEPARCSCEGRVRVRTDMGSLPPCRRLDPAGRASIKDSVPLDPGPPAGANSTRGPGPLSLHRGRSEGHPGGVGRIVVGVDGSEHAAAALRWAQREAEVHGHDLTALLAWSLFNQVHAGRDVDLLVLGSRGLGQLREFLLGSISQTCLHHAPCPVAIVRTTDEGPAATHDRGRIVVGIDGSELSSSALRWAIEEARPHSATVEAVHAWHVPYAVASMAAAMQPALFEDSARELLDRSVEAASRDVTDVRIERVLVSGSAADAILNAADRADAVVVGSRGVGGFRGLLLGSVSHQVAHHAACPVVVVPLEQRE